MGLITKLEGLVGSDERSYRYVGTNLEASFESSHADMSTVSCPECAAARVRNETPSGG